MRGAAFEKYAACSVLLGNMHLVGAVMNSMLLVGTVMGHVAAGMMHLVGNVMLVVMDHGVMMMNLPVGRRSVHRGGAGATGAEHRSRECKSDCKAESGNERFFHDMIPVVCRSG